MDTSALIPRIEAVAPGGVLEARPFGRRGTLSLWVEVKALHKIARCLKEEFCLTWLENLSVLDVDGVLVLNYFVRDPADAKNLVVVRASVVPSDVDGEAEVASVGEIWPTAVPFERESGELFGIRFGGRQTKKQLLPHDWVGFPLRKSYHFPLEFRGVAHSRPMSVPENEGTTNDE